MKVRIVELPPLIARSEIEKYFPGILKRATLAKLAAQGRGPRYTKLGRKVVYETRELMRWLEEQGVEIETVS